MLMEVIDHDQTAQVLFLKFILNNIMLLQKRILLSLSLRTIRRDKNLRNICNLLHIFLFINGLELN
jgi:hypothetical protein